MEAVNAPTVQQVGQEGEARHQHHQAEARTTRHTNGTYNHTIVQECDQALIFFQKMANKTACNDAAETLSQKV